MAKSKISPERQRYDELIKEIRHHDALYHQQDKPEITDAAYDALRREVDVIEAAHPDWVGADSPSRRVGAPVAEKFRKVEHSKPMLSLSNAFTEDDVRDFFDRMRRFLGLSEGIDIPVMAEPKIDGL